MPRALERIDGAEEVEITKSRFEIKAMAPLNPLSGQENLYQENFLKFFLKRKSHPYLGGIEGLQN